MLRDLFRKPQKPEDDYVWFLRIFVIVLFLVILMGSFAVMCLRMAREDPTISTTFTSIDSVLAPSIYLSFAYNFTINCWIYYDYGGTNETSCDEFVMQPKNTSDKDYPYGGTFSPKDIKLTRYDDIGPYFVYLNINIIDPKFSNLTESFFRMNLYDSENDYVIFDIESMKSGSISPFEESLFYLNKYTLTGGYLYKLGFSRKVRKILGQPALSYIGFPSSYHPKPYIESSIQSVPDATLEATHLKVRISPRNFIVEEEQEQRNDTILGALGIVAAYYSSIVFIYVFLFGVESMKPWGLIHDGCCGLLKSNEQQSEQIEQNEQEVPKVLTIDERVEELEELIKCIIHDTRKGGNKKDGNRNNSDNDGNNSDNDGNNSDNNGNNSDNNGNNSDNNGSNSINSNSSIAPIMKTDNNK